MQHATTQNFGRPAVWDHPQGVIRSSILTDFFRLSSAVGANPMILIDRVGIDRQCLEDADAVLPMSQLIELMELAALTSGVQDFGLRLAELRGLPDLGPINLMLREEGSVRAAVHTLIDYMHLHSNAACLTLEEHDYPVLSVSLMGCINGHQRQAIDASIAQTTSIIRWLLGEDWSPESVCFTHAQPLSIRRYSSFFRCPIDFLQEVNGIVISPHDLDRKLVKSSPMMRRQVERYLRSVGALSRDSYDRRVAKLITVALPKGEARAESIARHMGTTSRTLNRKLASFGINFSVILEDTRKDLTAQYLIEGDRPITDIAGMIGFNSLSAFSTWFKRAFGCTPRAWRNRHCGGRYDIWIERIDPARRPLGSDVALLPSV